jgi:hypothetical protein
MPVIKKVTALPETLLEKDEKEDYSRFLQTDAFI